MFPDQETSIWTYDEKAGSHYLHRFYRHQPDLNVVNPAVRDEIEKVIGFWLELGVSGSGRRGPVLHRAAREPGDHVVDPHEYLRELRSFMSRRTGDAVLLGEVNLPTRTRGSSVTTATSCRCSSTSSACRSCTWRWPGLTRAARQGPDGPSSAPAGVPVGDLRAQPRRANARQAHREGASRGVRGVRARTGDADLRSGPPPATAPDARGGPAAHPDGLQPPFSLPGTPVLFCDGEDTGATGIRASEPIPPVPASVRTRSSPAGACWRSFLLRAASSRSAGPTGCSAPASSLASSPLSSAMRLTSVVLGWPGTASARRQTHRRWPWPRAALAVAQSAAGIGAASRDRAPAGAGRSAARSLHPASRSSAEPWSAIRPPD